MRGNGLSARAYIAVADLDPGTADVLLVALADRGVAAYAASSPEREPEADTDRLYVDVAAVEQARMLLSVELAAAAERDQCAPDPSPGHSEPADAVDVDAVFASIVAGFHAAAVPGPWPAAEDLAPGPAEAINPAEASAGGAALTGSVGPIGWEDLLRPLPPPDTEPEPGYVPPPPPPLPPTSIGTRFAWAAVLGGPAVLFGAVLLGWQLADWVMLVAAVAFLGGFAALIAKLGDRPDDDDDGAVV